MDAPAEIRNNRTIVPIRVIAETFNQVVNWDGGTRTVYIGNIQNIESTVKNNESILQNNKPIVQVPTMTKEEIREKLYELVNKERETNGLKPLIYLHKLQDKADFFANKANKTLNLNGINIVFSSRIFINDSIRPVETFNENLSEDLYKNSLLDSQKKYIVIG